MSTRLMGSIAPDLYGGPEPRAQTNGATPGRHTAGTTVMRAEVGRATVEEMAEWTKGQIAYPNLANYTNAEGQREIGERALNYVLSVKQHYLAVTERVRAKALLLAKQLRGNSFATLGQTEIIHSPEIHKRIERIVPRLEEAMFAQDPPFRVRGRRELSKQQAMTIMAFMLWQLDAANADELVQPAIRSMLTYQFSMIHVRWCRQFDWRHIRQVSREFVNGRNEWRSERKHARVLTFDGPRLTLVDPTSAILDVRFLLEDDMDFIGHESSATWQDLVSQQEMGFLENIGRIQDTKGLPVYQEEEKRGRSLTPEAITHDGSRPKHGPRNTRITTLFGRYDLYNDGVERECMFVVANDKTLLRVSENPFDDKVRPYATAVASKDGFEFFGVGPLDHALSLNNALDKLRTIGFRTAEFNMTPIFSSEDGEETPDSLRDIEPGTRIPGGKLTQIQVGNSLESLVTWGNILINDLDESTGAPPIFGGTDESETATQAVKNLGEANKRMRSYLRAQSRMWTRVHEIMHAFNRQFVVGDQAFRVIGKAAALLGVPYASVNPETFLPEVDFDFVAMDGIFNAATRGTAMMQWLTAAAPFLSAIPGVNIPKLLKVVWDSMIGGPDDDDIVRISPMLDELVPQTEENQSLLQGIEVPVNPADPHQDHIMDMMPALEELKRHGKDVNPEVVAATMKHLEEHLVQAARQENAKAARAGFVDPAPPRQGQVPGMENRSENPEGNAGLDPTAVAQTPTMETPGPGSTQQTAKPGRRAGAPQGDNTR